MYKRSRCVPQRRGQRAGCQGIIGLERLTCGTDWFGSHVSSSKVVLYRMGHDIGGMARHTCRAPRPTAVVTLGLSRVPPWRMFIGHSGHDERALSLREWTLVQVFLREIIRFTICARRLWLKPVPDAVHSLQFSPVSDAEKESSPPSRPT